MDPQIESLNRLLRCEMTAVHQQFIHVLVLRDWGETESAERIMKVDRVDFPNAMKIIDYLVSVKAPINLHGTDFKPGRTHHGILAAEFDVEQRFAEVIEQGDCTDIRPRELFAAAKAPRRYYLQWLNTQLDSLPLEEDASADHTQGTARLFGYLLTIIEQSLVHAFVHYHKDRTDFADTAWSTSGAAMMQATAFVHLYAARRTVPFPEHVPSPQIQYQIAGILDSDIQLAHRCAAEATEAAVTCSDAEINTLCRQIADSYTRLVEFKPGATHSPSNLNPPAFQSFQATLQRFQVR